MLKGRKPPLVPGRVLDAARDTRRRKEWIDRALTRVEITSSVLGDHPILIYSMGKVGTSALLESVEAATHSRVLKCHSLTREGLADSTRRHHEIGETHRPRMQWQHAQLAQVIASARWKRWEMVCGVREPVARSTSAYFHWLRRSHELNKSVDQSEDFELHAKRIALSLSRGAAADWFEDELHKTTGIDVYAESFPHQSGHRVYENARFRAIVIRQEDLAALGPGALGEFFGLSEPLEVTTKNRASATVQASLYRDFLSEYQFSESVIDRAYSAKQTRHFYSHEELARLHARWTGGLGGFTGEY